MLSLNDLNGKANQIRKICLSTAVKAGKGHIPPAYSWTDIAVALFYGGVLKYEADNPKWGARNKFILSKGHACLSLYAILADLNFFNSRELDKFAGDGTLLAGHPDVEIPGVEVCSGSLGHGLGVASGFALANQLDGKSIQTFVVLGDGECHEGSIWEAAMFAGQRKLNTLTAIIDRNGLGATDFTENYASLEPLNERFESFGWEVCTVDGHDIPKLIEVLKFSQERRPQNRPFCIIANTIKGKGVSFMENSKYWHHKMPNSQQVQLALEELDAL